MAASHHVFNLLRLVLPGLETYLVMFSIIVKAHHQVFLGFVRVWTLALAHVLHLPTNSVQIFRVGLNFWGWVESESSLHTEERGDEARESLAFRVGFQVGQEGQGAGVGQ